jgi:hypothetical protein
MGLAIETRKMSAGTVDRRPAVVGRQSGIRGGDTVKAVSHPMPLVDEAVEGQGGERGGRGARWRWWLAVFLAEHPSACP